MITKTYTSKTSISLNVVLGTKKNLHISFSPLSNGTSTYVTSNEQIQSALERHYNFNKLFKLSETSSGEPVVASENVSAAPQEKKLTVIKVSDLASAKDYLADKFAVSRTRMRGIESITAQALAHGIVFEGIE